MERPVCTRPLLECKCFAGAVCEELDPGCTQEAVLSRGKWVEWQTAMWCRQAVEGKHGLNRTRNTVEPGLDIDRQKNCDKTFSLFLLLVTGLILGSQRLEVVRAGGGSSRCSTSCMRSSAPWRLHTLKVLGRNTASLRQENCCSSSCRDGEKGRDADRSESVCVVVVID